jgi:hypothetical protein
MDDAYGDEIDTQTMIAYKESDVIDPNMNQPNLNLPKTCGYVKEIIDDDDEEEEDFDEEEIPIFNRTKREITGELFLDLRQTRCPLLLVADYR